MSDNRIQASFNSGEFAPTLFARVDLAKYRSAAALLENWFVDYRGGASTRPGTKYILQAYKSATAVRLISFQAAFSVGYVMEFGDFYIRFFLDGAPILETGFAITAATKANPGVLTVTGNNFSTGDWIRVSGVVGMTELNGNYYNISVSGSAVTLRDLNGVNVDTSTFTTYISGGLAERIYTLPSPYAAADLALLKFAQNIDQMFICHPSYAPYILTTITSNNWTLNPIVIGSSITAPTGVSVATTLAAGTVNYSYIVTAVDANGQESAPSSPGALANRTDLRTIAGTNRITWNAVSGALSYNIYKAYPSYSGAVAGGASYGFIGNVTSTTFDDSNITADYSLTPPIVKNPFQGAGLASVTITASSLYTVVPSAVVDAAPGGGQTATVSVAAQAYGNVAVIGNTTPNAYTVGQAYDFGAGSYGTLWAVCAASFGGVPTAWEPMSFPGSFSPSVPQGATVPGVVISPGVTQLFRNSDLGVSISVSWGVRQVNIVSAGAGYLTAPAITFSAGAATATTTLAPTTAGNPSVPGFFQQRLILAAPAAAPQTFYMSQPGNYTNFNVANPVLPEDSITGTLVSGQLNTIKAMVPQTSGLLMFTDKYSWIINGGSNGSAISTTSIVANAQSFNGISDVPPIIANYDVLYVQAKGSVIRDSAFNIYQNVFTGTDISLLSSHLFYTYSVLEWAFAEEPFKLIQAIRNDGTLLTLTFLKEQEFIGWTHSVTNGSFKSVCTVTEVISQFNNVDATYFVVERDVNGFTVKYIERLADRQFPNGVADAWCVDAGLEYNGAPATTFSGGQHLAGLTVTGLADGELIPSFTMPINGTFTLTTAASQVVVGESFVCDLQTLPLELGEPTVQGKAKKIPSVDVRVADTLGLKIGSDFTHLTPMKDLIRGNVSSMLTGQSVQRVTDLISGDARTFLDPTYTVPGQYCIRQDLPYPATVLGVIPSVVVGDTPPGRTK